MATGTSILEVFAGIVARLAQASNVGEEVPAVLETIREVVDADECVLWLDGPNGMVRAGTACRPGAVPDAPRASGAGLLATVEMQAVVAGSAPAAGTFAAPIDRKSVV